MKYPLSLSFALIACPIVLGGKAHASPECYDAIVSARIVEQTPSVMPDCDDCIIMQWPWFLELDVDRVDVGDAPTGRHTLQAMLHTYFRNDLGAQQWWLRRNTLGGFNLLRGVGTDITLCPPETAPARPYIDPGPGRTLLDIKKEGEAYYGRRD